MDTIEEQDRRMKKPGGGVSPAGHSHPACTFKESKDTFILSR